MLIALFILSAAHASTSESMTPNQSFQEADDPQAGVVVDAVEPGSECSSGIVIAQTAVDGGIEVRELHAGKVQNDDLLVTDKAVQAHLTAGERVVIYRDARGIAVVGAS